MTRPLHILLANSGRKWIGEIGHCVQLYDALAARGHRVWLACRLGADLERHARERELRHVSLGFASRFSPRGDAADARAMADLIRRESIDVVHVHRGKDHWVGAMAARRTRKPLVRTRHVVTPVKNHLFNRWLLQRATAAVISVSRAAEASFGDLRARLPRPRVILSAVDRDRFHPSRRSDEWRRETGGPEADIPPIWIGLIGRFQNIKGQQVFLEAAGIVRRELPEARFLLAGKGPESKRAKYRALARQGGFEDRLTIEGHLDDLPRVMASLDVGVVASIGSEGSSRVTLEMMASGVPVVASAVGGIPDVLMGEDAAEFAAPEPGKFIEAPHGLMTAPGDARALAEGILRLARDRESAMKLAGAARRRVETHHDPDRWAAQIEKVYREVIVE